MVLRDAGAAMRWGCGVAVAVVLAFVVRRVLEDFPVFGSPLSSSVEDVAYAHHTLVAYLHIAPATIYLTGGALQLNAGFRRRHLRLHRWLGRVVLICGLICGVFAIAFGLLWPTGGASEATTTVVFGVWFEICLLNAFRSVREGRLAGHRLWMIRAYAVGSAVGTIRLVVLVLLPIGFGAAFAIAFPTAFVLHAAAAELWLNTAPRGPRLSRSRS